MPKRGAQRPQRSKQPNRNARKIRPQNNQKEKAARKEFIEKVKTERELDTRLEQIGLVRAQPGDLLARG